MVRYAQLMNEFSGSGGMDGSVLNGSGHGGPKLGRKPVFSAGEAVDAAVAEGIDTFTLSAVARRLGVVTAAIYRVFSSRDDLVNACVDRAVASIALPEQGMHWQDTLRLWANECWRLCEEYRGLSRLVFAYPAAQTRITHIVAVYEQNLMAQGKNRKQTMFALDFIGDTVFSSHLGVDSMRALDDEGKSGLDTVRDAVGDMDTLFQPDDSWMGRAVMDKKVSFILTGLEQNWPEF